MQYTICKLENQRRRPHSSIWGLSSEGTMIELCQRPRAWEAGARRFSQEMGSHLQKRGNVAFPVLFWLPLHGWDDALPPWVKVGLPLSTDPSASLLEAAPETNPDTVLYHLHGHPSFVPGRLTLKPHKCLPGIKCWGDLFPNLGMDRHSLGIAKYLPVSSTFMIYRSRTKRRWVQERDVEGLQSPWTPNSSLTKLLPKRTREFAGCWSGSSV